MPVITKFGGLIPRMSEHSKPIGLASEAVNVSLCNGRVEPWRERAYLYPAVTECKSFFLRDCCLYSWDACVEATDYLVDFGRLFLTGRSSRPEVTPTKSCGSNYTYLGVPAPTNVLTVSGAESYGETSDARSYVYTYINGYGEESAPSPASRQLTVKDGSPVTVSGFATPPEGWGIVGMALYRTATGSRVSDEELQNQEPVTNYFMVTMDIALTSFTDTVLTRDLGLILTTEDDRLPPETLRHIQTINNTGILMGVTRNQVHFSNNFQPWNWPARNDITVPYNIVNACSLDTKVFVSTDAKPFIIDMSNTCDPNQLRPIQDADVPLPDISCGRPHSAIVTPFGMVYSSPDGLVLFNSQGQWSLLTAPWYSAVEWRLIRPDTAILAYWNGMIFCSTEIITFVLQIDLELYKSYDSGQLSTISDKPDDMFVTKAGELLMLEDDAIWQWNAGNTYRKYLWASAYMDFPSDISPTALKVKTKGVTATLQAPNGLSYTRFAGEKPIRLGRLGRHDQYRVILEGDQPVDYLELGTATMTLGQGV